MSQDSSKKRNQKESLYLFSILMLIGSFLFVVIPSQSAEEIEKTKLNEILEKTAEYCEKLENSSLDFTCVEEIKERIYYQQGFTRFHNKISCKENLQPRCREDSWIGMVK